MEGKNPIFERENLSSIIVGWSVVLSLIVAGILFFIAGDYRPRILGFLFGSLMSVLSFKLMEATAKKAVKKSPDNAYKYTLKHYFLRYVLYFIVLFVAALADYLSFSTTVFGLLVVKLVITIFTIVDSYNSRKNR